MNDPTPLDTPKPEKKRKPARPSAIRGKWSLSDFRGLLERVASRPEQFTDEQIRFAQGLLHKLSQDNAGTIRITISPPASESVSPKQRFSALRTHSTESPDDDVIRKVAREIALIENESSSFERIDSLDAGFLLKAAALYGFRAETHMGLKTAFAAVVADIRQMENIAAARPRQPQEPGTA